MTAHGEAEELVDLAHPLGVALGQIVVHESPRERRGRRGAFKVAGERCNESLPSPVFISEDLAVVQNHAADQLHIEVAHLHGAPAGLRGPRPKPREESHRAQRARRS